jgi:hypothetical protein
VTAEPSPARVAAVNSIGPDGATSLAEALKVNTTIMVIDISGEGARGAGVNSIVTRGPTVDNRIGDVGASAFAAALSKSAVRTADLGCACRAMRQPARDRARLLNQGATVTPRRVTHRNDIAITVNDIGDEGAAAIAAALKLNTTVEVVRLDSEREWRVCTWVCVCACERRTPALCVKFVSPCVQSSCCFSQATISAMLALQ